MRVGQARKRDANEPMIVDALKKAGVRVTKASIEGFPDLICYKSTHGVQLLEVKAPDGKLTPAQVKHTAEGWPVVIVRSPADALAVFGVTQ